MFQGTDQLAGFLTFCQFGILENVGCPACIYLQVFPACPDGFRHLTQHQVHHLAVDTCIILQLTDDFQINLFNGQSVQTAVQQDVQVQQLIIGQLVGHIHHGVLDDVSFHHHHHQQFILLHLGELDELKLGLVVTGAAYHGCVIGIGCKYLGHLLKDQFQFIHLLDHHLLKFRYLAVLLQHDLVHVKPVSLIRRNTARRCMGLYDITHLLQV